VEVAPPPFPPRVVALVKAIACELPATLGLPLSRFSRSELRRHVLAAGIVAEISGVTIWRWLREDAIRPWTHRSWIFPRDPEFAAKAGPVLDLYHRRWKGKPLGRRDFVLSADEKTQIPIHSRRQPITPATPGRAMRVKSDYKRHGTCAYVAAWDVHRAACSGWSTTALSIVGSARSTGSRRDGPTSSWCTCRCTRVGSIRSRFTFSILQRQALTPAAFSSQTAVADRILGFQKHYQTIARPFAWRFTRRISRNS